MKIDIDKKITEESFLKQPFCLKLSFKYKVRLGEPLLITNLSPFGAGGLNILNHEKTR
ncbi:hypothetical protein JYT74_02735 [Crocinitomix catalasitica]|nr:hypothetical protein [Crocinitomix catalasitica]